MHQHHVIIIIIFKKLLSSEERRRNGEESSSIKQENTTNKDMMSLKKTACRHPYRLFQNIPLFSFARHRHSRHDSRLNLCAIAVQLSCGSFSLPLYPWLCSYVRFPEFHSIPKAIFFVFLFRKWKCYMRTFCAFIVSYTHTKSK